MGWLCTLLIMDGTGVSPHVGTSSSSQRRKKVCTEAHRASALSAKVERGRVKLQHRQNTLLYYASSCNQSNAKPLELVSNIMPLRSFAPGFDASNELASVFTPHVVAKAVGDFAVVGGSPASSSDARHAQQTDYIIIGSTSEDGGAETTNDLQEVSVPNFDEDYDEDGESLAPKKKLRKNYDLT